MCQENVWIGQPKKSKSRKCCWSYMKSDVRHQKHQNENNIYDQKWPFNNGEKFYGVF